MESSAVSEVVEWSNDESWIKYYNSWYARELVLEALVGLG